MTIKMLSWAFRCLRDHVNAITPEAGLRIALEVGWAAVRTGWRDPQAYPYYEHPRLTEAQAAWLKAQVKL